MPGRFQVAGSAIIEKDGKVLITRRSPQCWLGGTWEFVSGRVEQGEDLIEGLKREVREEVSLEIKVLDPIYVAHFYRGEEEIPENEIFLVTYVCQYISGEVKLDIHEQDKYLWINPSELTQYDSLMKYYAEEVKKYLEYKK